MAHPGLLPNPDLMDPLLKMGVKGIEAYHSKHTQEESRYYSGLAHRHGLLVTGGSDCHGERHDGMPMIGDVTVGMEVVEALKSLSAGG